MNDNDLDVVKEEYTQENVESEDDYRLNAIDKMESSTYYSSSNTIS